MRKPVPIMFLDKDIDYKDESFLSCVGTASSALVEAFNSSSDEEKEEFTEILICKDHKLVFFSFGKTIIVVSIKGMFALNKKWSFITEKYNIVDEGYDKDKEKRDIDFENFMNHLIDFKKDLSHSPDE